MPHLKDVHTLLARLLTLDAYRPLQYFVVAVGMIAMIVNTMPNHTASLQIVLWSCLGYFAAAWALRVVHAVRSGRPSAYLRSGMFVFDALAVLPTPIALAFGVPQTTAWLFGTFWMLKTAILSPGLSRLARVIKVEAKPLSSVLVIFTIVIFFAATLMHLIEGDGKPEAFGTLPASMWWAIATLTTVGYGDAVPITHLGRIVAGIVMICGVGVFGLLTGILATGFVEDSRRHNFVQNWQVVKSVPFFRSLDPVGLIEISRMLRRLDISEGTTVVRRGREGDCMYFIAAGEVEVEIMPPVRLGPGAFFGEMALLGDGVRNATVTTTLPSTLLVLDLADFRAFTATHPGLAEVIEAEAISRAGEAKQVTADSIPREIVSPRISD
jgi:voltage-gated potassium channel